MEQMQDEIFVLKKGRNDAYHLNQILREDIGRIMDRIKNLDHQNKTTERETVDVNHRRKNLPLNKHHARSASSLSNSFEDHSNHDY